MSEQEQAFERAEAEELLDRAADLQTAAESSDAISGSTLTESAAEAGIAPEFVQEAIRASRAEKVEAVARRSTLRNLGIGAGGVVVVLVIVTQATLSGPRAEALAALAQVENVTDRRDSLLGQLRSAGVDARAVQDEIIGAENRIAVERQRYQQAAAAYNRAAGTFPRSLFRGLLGYPKELPLD